MPRTSLKYNQVRGYTAIYMLGKLASKKAVPDLLHILRLRDGFTIENIENDEFLSDEAELRFQYVSHTMMALTRIGERHKDTRPLILKSFEHYIAHALDQSLVISFKGSSEILNVMDDKIKLLVDQVRERWEK